MSITLEDIQNLSAEVGALVEAGLPLEANLADAGAGHGQRLENLTKQISDSLESGTPLDETIRQQNIGPSRMLCAAVAAGIRTGNLAQSVEMLGDMASDLVDLRRRILSAISYPMTVVVVALTLFCFFIRAFLARVYVLISDPTQPSTGLLRSLLEFDMKYWWWPYLLPAVGLLCLLLWVISGRAASMAFRGPEYILFLLPGVRGLVRDLQFYNLSRMLSLLIDRQVPLHEALRLAGASSGHRGLDFACDAVANSIQTGELPAAPAIWTSGALPPLLHACLGHAGAGEDLFRERLRSVAAYYRRRVQVSSMWLRNIVPIAMFVIIGGGTVTMYAFSVFWPVTEIYRHVTPA